MRLGRGNWRSGTRAAVAACAALFIFAAPASAADRHAVPSGGLSSGTCGVGSECDLKYAIENAAAGDAVILGAGTYTVSSPIAGSDVVVRGAGSTATTIIGSADIAGTVVTLDTGATIADLRIESINASAALDLIGTADSLEVYSSAGTAMILRGGGDLVNSVVHSSATGAVALEMSGGLLVAPSVRHSTVIATGSGSTALDASGILVSPTMRASIANGVTYDVVGAMLYPVSIQYSAYRSAQSSYDSPGSGIVNAAATFEDAAARKFQQDPASPTVDAGDNSDNLTVDIAGRQRTIAGGTDMGAYELPIPPTAVTGAATTPADGITANVAGSVNPRGTATTYVFDYGTTSPPADAASTSTSAGSGTVDVAVDADLSGLKPGTRYYYRVAATSAWGTTNGAISTFDTPTIAPVASSQAPSPVDATAARLRGNVHPGGESTSAKFEWGETASYGSSSAPETVTGSDSTALTPVTATGLKPNTQYHYRVVATNSKGTSQTADATFTTPARAPIVTGVASSGLTTSAATLSGTVDPGGDTTTWDFEYGTGDYGQTAVGGSLTGITPQAVSRTLTGLLPGTRYQYRLAARNSKGTVRTAGTFTTDVAPPTASLGAASGIGARSVRVAGTLNPGGDVAGYRFEYGRPGSLNQSVASTVADGTDDVTVTRDLIGLEPATTYGYRLVATNSAGTDTTTAGTFTTAVAQPGATTGRASGVTRNGARLSGAVNPGGAPTTWSFEYGRTRAYGQSTAPASMSASNRDEPVAADIENLEPGVTYHYRLVARNEAGETVGGDATFRTEDAAAVAHDGPVQADGLPVTTEKPKPGRATNVAPANGTVRVHLPGTNEFVELTEGASIPVGTTVDATQGDVTITSAADLRGTPQTANFGGSEFKIKQKRAAKPITDIVMTGGDFTGCFPRALSKRSADVFAAARRKWSRRRLWGNGHGRFRTRGRHGTATVRGTHWLTEDRCDGTLVRVKRGLVAVRDLERRRTVMVGAGDRYFAKSLARKKPSRKKR